MLIAGSILLMAGVAVLFFGTRAIRSSVSFGGKKRTTLPVELDKPAQSPVIRVSTDHLCRMILSMEVESTSVEETTSFDETEYKLRYQFPVEYQFVNAEDERVFSEETTAAWNSGLRTISGTPTTAQGGRSRIEHAFDTFRAQPPGEIRLKVRMQADVEYSAQAKNISAGIYDQVSEQGLADRAGKGLGGCGMLLIGPLLMLAGLILLLIGGLQ